MECSLFPPNLFKNESSGLSDPWPEENCLLEHAIYVEFRSSWMYNFSNLPWRVICHKSSEEPLSHVRSTIVKKIPPWAWPIDLLWNCRTVCSVPLELQNSVQCTKSNGHSALHTCEESCSRVSVAGWLWINLFIRGPLLNAFSPPSVKKIWLQKSWWKFYVSWAVTVTVADSPLSVDYFDTKNLTLKGWHVPQSWCHWKCVRESVCVFVCMACELRVFDLKCVDGPASCRCGSVTSIRMHCQCTWVSNNVTLRVGGRGRGSMAGRRDRSESNSRHRFGLHLFASEGLTYRSYSHSLSRSFCLSFLRARVLPLSHTLHIHKIGEGA